MPNPPAPRAVTEPPRRLFVAVPLDAPTRQAIERHLAHLARLGPLPGRLVPPDNWHVTLRFLGDVNARGEAALVRALDDAAWPAAFAMTFGRLGAFSTAARARVLWLGVDEGAVALARLAALADGAAASAGLGSDGRVAAHLTLSRLRPGTPGDVRRLVDAAAAARIATTVTEVVLYESELGGGPARYAVRHRVALPAAERSI